MSHIGAEDRGGREFFPSEEESSEPPLLLIPHHLSLLLLLLAFNSEDLFTEPFFCFLLDADLTKKSKESVLFIYLFILCFIFSFEGCSVDQLHGGQTAFLADINALCHFA